MKVWLLLGSALLQVSFANALYGAVQFTNLFSFSFGAAYGGQPHCQLARDEAGNLYGTTGQGVLGNINGTVFKISSNGSIIWSVPLGGENGGAPNAGLVRDRWGNLYGTTAAGGRFNHGTVFKISPEGRFIWSAPFDSVNGSQPQTSLIEGEGGNFYGTTYSGGFKDLGTVFRVNPNGRITRIYSFVGGEDGAHPISELCRGPGGVFYGTTFGAPPPPIVGIPGYVGNGTVFRITAKGALTTLHAFGAITNLYRTGLDGAYPTAGVLLDTRHLYGTTSRGGTNDLGTVFKMDLNGNLVWSHSFDGTNGAGPQGNLVRGDQGVFYGTTQFGGNNQVSGFFGVLRVGTVFRITSDGALTIVYSFGREADSLGNPLDGAFPSAGLTSDLRGNFFGTTLGGFFNPGTVFQLSVARPVLAIIDPRHGRTLNQSDLLISGKTKPKLDVEVTNVLYRTGDSDWQSAESTDNWTNWNASVALSPGINLFRAYAIDATGDVSRTNVTRLRFNPR